MSQTTLASTASLLAEVFPGSRIADETYLRWLYEEAPFGPVIERNRSDEHGQIAHYAVVPVDLVLDGERVSGALSLNTAVHERARGGGVFVKLASETYEAAREQGVRVVIGVANGNSTPGFERRLAFTNHGPLPATVLVPLPGRNSGVRSGWSTQAADAALKDVDAFLAPSRSGLTRRWTTETLRWRLASPGAQHAVHRSDDALVVTTVERRHGLCVAIVLAAFARRVLTRAEARALVSAACRFHRAPVALHAGVNDRVPFRGRSLPERFRESPLNLITRPLDDRPAVPGPSRFEFLDFDPY